MYVSAIVPIFMSISKAEYERLGLQAFVGNPLVKKLRSASKELRKSDQQMRDEFIKEKFEQGGKPFVERVKRWGRTERDTPVIVDPWLEELLTGIGDFRIGETATLGCSQASKTLSHTLLVADTVVYGRLSTAYFYDSLTNLQSNAPIQQHSVIEHYISAAEKDGLKFNRERDRKMLTRYQCQLITAYSSYVSTGRTGNNDSGQSAVGAVAASFTADLLIEEERSQYPPGAADPLPRRVDASLIPTRPIRSLSTPAAGGGIEMELKRMEYDFFPHIECPHCGEIIALDPMGCLLKPYERTDSSGNKKIAYLTESGRPHSWWHTDEDDPVHSAYIGCSNCGMPIDDETRYSAKYKCRKTGVWFREWNDAIPPGIPERKLTAAFWISPLIRRTKVNLAFEIIQTGINATSPLDWSQQMLGRPSEASVTSLTMEILKRSIEAPKPERVPVVRLAGCDQGRGSYYLGIADIYLPKDYKKMPVEDVIEKAQRDYLFLGEVHVNQIPNKLLEYKVQFMGLDQEPDRSRAAILQRDTVAVLMDQIAGLKDAVRKVDVKEGGNTLKIYQLRNEKFLGQVMNSFITAHPDDGYPLSRLPEHFSMWLHTPTESSPIRQLCSIKYDPYAEKFKKTDGNDHAFYSCNFLEAMLYIYLTEDVSNAYVAGSLCTVENSAPTATYTPLGYGQPRGGRRGSFIPRSNNRRY